MTVSVKRKILFALVKSGFSLSGFGKIWSAPYWNISKIWMPLLCHKMTKSLCPPPNFPHPSDDSWTVPNMCMVGITYTLQILAKSGQIKIGGLPKSESLKNGNLCASPIFHPPVMTSEQSQICAWCGLFLAQPHHTWSMLHSPSLQLVLVLHLDEISSVLVLPHMKKGLNA